jgi:hypothetical protein
MNYDIIKQDNFSKKGIFLCLLPIGIIGLLVRMYFEPATALTGDATNYFVYAVDTGLKGKLSDVYFLANSGWSLFLSAFFSITKYDDPLFLMELQRSLSIFISVVTIIPIYLLCRRFFNQSYSLVGASLFLFQPHIITNSSLGITEPLFLFLGISSLALFLSNNHKIVYASFAVTGLFTLIRFEGILFFVMLSIMFFVKYRNERKYLLRYPLVLTIFVLVLLPIAYTNFETHGRDGFTSELFDRSGASYQTFIEGKPDVGDPLYGDVSSSNIQNFLTIGTKNMIWLSGIAAIPIFVFFVPIGIILIIKNKNNLKINFQIVTVTLVSITMFIPAFYTYARGADDVRFLFMIFPLLILISVYGISRWKIKRQNLLLAVIIGAIFLTSFMTLDFKKIDSNYENEVFSVTKFISGKTNIINDGSADIRYRTSAGIIVHWPDLPQPTSESHVDRSLKLISITGYNSLLEFVDSSKDKGLTYLAIDGREHQPEFLRDVFYHDEKYPYLKKIYDSSDLGMTYHVKVYEIDYVRMHEN